jgi:hypothetical protein
MRPEYTADVLAQKARDAARQLVAPERPADEAYGFQWNESLVKFVMSNDKPRPDWTKVYTQRPSPLGFWYRQSKDVLTGFAFHTDLLTPGIVDSGDPPAIVSGMTSIELDHQGHLIFFETIPPQRQDAPTHPAPVDWAPLFVLAGLDIAQLKPVDPLWNWLAGPDTRAAWTGTWPASGRPLRVEAAALGGRPVAFMVSGPWQKPWREPEPSESRQTLTVILLFALAFGVLGGAGWLARRNLREERGDRAGAARLAACMTTVLLAVWLCQVHLVASLGLLAMFLVAICTSVFYGVLVWTVYVALEPYVRKRWPQVLVSWTSILSGRIRDGVVGRDVLVGVALGVAWVLMLRGVDLLTDARAFANFPGATELLTGLRSTLGIVLQGVPYAMRNVLFNFFMLFMLRVLLRNEWAAAAAFALLWAALGGLSTADHPWSGALISLLYFGTGAFAVLRFGLLPYAVAIFISELLLKLPATVDTSAWYFGNMLLLVLVAVALAGWGLYTSVLRPVRQPA